MRVELGSAAQPIDNKSRLTIRIVIGEDRQPNPNEADDHQEHIFRTYGVIVDFGKFNRKTEPKTLSRGKVLPPEDQLNVLRMLRPEFAKYPPEFIRDYSQLKRIRVLEGLQYHNNAINKHYLVGGIIYYDDNFYLAPQKQPDGSINPWLKRAFHHEEFHQADNKDGLHDDNPRWIALNPQGETVYLHDKYHLNPELVAHTPGFERPYGMIEPNEDQATVADRLMDDTAVFLRQMRHTNDKVLAKKVHTIQQEYYGKWSKRMRGRYWKHLAAGKVDEDYWDPRVFKLFL